MGRSRHFGDRLVALVEERQSQLLLGLDPDPRNLLPGVESDGKFTGPSEGAAAAAGGHCRLLIEAVGDLCVGVKLQLACFERLGPAGNEALRSVINHARDAGLMVIADGKRGDVPHSSVAYADALFGGIETPWGIVEGLGADAVTVNPLLGADSVEPFVTAAEREGAGVFVLVRTSNEGAQDLQDQRLESGPLHEEIARMVDRLGRSLVGREGLSSVGAVVGANVPGRIGPLRKLMPHAPFLIPGVGAQGGDPDELKVAFDPHPAAALVTATRSIERAHEKTGEKPLDAARQEAKTIRDACWRISAD